MTQGSSDITTLATTCRHLLGDPTTYQRPTGYPDSLSLCVLDSIWSMGVHYDNHVKPVLGRYRDLRAQVGADADRERLDDMIRAIDGLGGGRGLAEAVKNHQRTSTSASKGIGKSDAVLLAARSLNELGVACPQDILAADEKLLREAEDAWKRVPGQRSGISWHYFLMLGGWDGVKPDRMIRRFIARALSRSSASKVGVSEAVELVTAAASELETTAGSLDHRIWSYQRTRPA